MKGSLHWHLVAFFATWALQQISCCGPVLEWYGRNCERLQHCSWTVERIVQKHGEATVSTCFNMFQHVSTTDVLANDLPLTSWVWFLRLSALLFGWQKRKMCRVGPSGVEVWSNGKFYEVLVRPKVSIQWTLQGGCRIGFHTGHTGFPVLCFDCVLKSCVDDAVKKSILGWLQLDYNPKLLLSKKWTAHWHFAADATMGFQVPVYHDLLRSRSDFQSVFVDESLTHLCLADSTPQIYASVTIAVANTFFAVVFHVWKGPRMTKVSSCNESCIIHGMSSLFTLTSASFLWVFVEGWEAHQLQTWSIALAFFSRFWPFFLKAFVLVSILVSVILYIIYYTLIYNYIYTYIYIYKYIFFL